MTTVDRLLAAANAELGYGETPPGSNRTKYAAAADHANGYAWCATFIVAMCRKVGLTLPSESAYTPTMANAFKAAGRWHTTPEPGDIAFFDFPDSKKRIQHVGIVESVGRDTIVCIEGNTSKGVGGSQDNGGGVYRRTRPRKHVVGYGRPEFIRTPKTNPPRPTGDTLMRYPEHGYLVVTVGKDGKGTYDLPLHFDKVVSVTVKANDNGSHPKVTILPTPNVFEPSKTVLTAEGVPGNVGFFLGVVA